MFPNKIKLVTFDATNTLLKFCISPWEYYVKIASDHGYKVTQNSVKEQFLKNYKILTKDYPNFGKESIHWENWWRKIVHGTFNGQIKDPTVINSIANVLIEDFKSTKCWCTANGTIELLKYLKNTGVILGVISNFDPRLHEVLHNICLYSYFKFVLTSYETGYSKPDKRIFDTAIKLSSATLKPHECLHIGDDIEKDFEGAKSAGWHVILVTENHKSLKHVNPKCLFHNLNELNQKIQTEKLFT